MKTGLTIGKYAPFHIGHQLIIDTALKEVDELIVIVYAAPNRTNIPLKTRADWIRKLYPMITVIEAQDVPKDVGYTEEIQQKHENYILYLLNGRKIDCFYSSELYGYRMSKALHCENCLVDTERSVHTISGTEIRKDAYKNRHFINPIVYADLIIKVAVVGSDSKYFVPSLAEALAQKYDTIYATVCDEQTVYQANKYIFIELENLIILGPNCIPDIILYSGNQDSYDSTTQYNLSGSLDEQMDQVIKILNSYSKY